MTLELVHPREAVKVPIETLMMKCHLFADNAVLAGAPYSVRAPVSVDDFRQFVSALEGNDVEVTNSNFGSLSLLCDEFCFFGLSERLSVFGQSSDFKKDTEVRHSETSVFSLQRGSIGRSHIRRKVPHLNVMCQRRFQIGGSPGAAFG
jgi:hypothetical protein